MSKNFQILGWTETNEYTTFYEEDEQITTVKYVIKINGTGEEGEKITCYIKNYEPFIFINMPETWDKKNARKMILQIQKDVDEKNARGLKKIEIIKKKEYYRFTNEQYINFIKITFENTNALYEFTKSFESNKQNLNLTNNFNFILYDSKLKNFIKFMHSKNIMASGWVSVSNFKFVQKKTYSDVEIECGINDIIPYDKQSNSKIIICSFDLECKPGDNLSFPKPEKDNDNIIQIGSVFSYHGCSEPFLKHIITFKSCDKIEILKDVDIESYESEKSMLLAWKKLILRVNPDVITGYNINGFDFKYLQVRAEKLGIAEEFSYLGRVIKQKSIFKKDSLQSSAMGKNELSYYDMQGRIILDLMQYCRRNHNLDSYKLDNVASSTIKDKIISCDKNEDGTSIITTESAFGIYKGNYVSIMFFDGLTDNIHDKKFKVLDIQNSKKINKKTGKEYVEILINNVIPEEILKYSKVFWCHAKDDLKMTDMFKMQDIDGYNRAIIASYCIMDCVLVLKIMEKLQVLNSSIAMSNVCSVPLSFIFMRGQSIKLLSLVSKKCNEHDFLIPALKGRPENYADLEKEKYEGAIVFQPKVGIYDEPIPVLDYASLYPSSMICYNISHETLIKNDELDKIDLTKYKIHTIDFMVDNPDKTKKKVVCNYAEKLDGSKGIIPMIEIELLAQRKKCKKMMETAEGDLKKIYDGFQNAYKITANSLYGQLGADVSAIYLLELAQSITAVGRLMLNYSKQFIEGPFGNLINYAQEDKNKYFEYATNYFEEFPDRRFKSDNYSTKSEFIEYFYNKVKSLFKENERVKPKIIYGDTDSVFYSPKIHNIEDKIIKTDVLKLSIEIGKLSGETICMTLPEPEKQVYEKTLYPLILLSKKRYVGNLYEDDIYSFIQKSMGIVLKRRDNAKIVKIVVGGVVNFLLNEKNNVKAVEYTRSILKKILRGEYKLDKFIISKTLKDNYKNPNAQAHAVLAKRIADRGGEAPAVNDRVPYAFIVINKKTKLQSDKVESPDFIVENNLELDYLYYIEKQIMKPCIQFLNLISPNADVIFKNCIVSETNRRKGKLSIKKYFNNDNNNSIEENKEDVFSKILNMDNSTRFLQKPVKKAPTIQIKKSSDSKNKFKI